MEKLRWMRVVGDTAFAVGAILLVAFVGGLASGHSFSRPASRKDAEAISGHAPAGT
jgi:nitric oxide reductase subunit B